MNCSHEEKSYIVACDLCKTFFRKRKHLKKHVKIFHSGKSSKTIIEHNLVGDASDRKEKSMTVDNENQTKVNNFQDALKECKKSMKFQMTRKIHFNRFLTRVKILSKYRKIMSRLSKKSKLNGTHNKSKVASTLSGKPIKKCDVRIKKMKIKPVSVRHCQVREYPNESSTVSVCDLCDQEFPMRKHLQLHQEFCRDIYLIRFKCKNHLLTSELCSSLSFKLY